MVDGTVIKWPCPGLDLEMSVCNFAEFILTIYIISKQSNMLVKHINNLFHCILQGNAKFDFLIDAITECCRNVMARSLNF